MRCPACHAPLGDADTECPACRFNLAALEASLGPPPRVNGHVTDLAGALRPGEVRRLSDDLALIEQQFPGMRAMVVAATPPPQVTAELYAFWLFNRAGVFSAVETGGGNHGLMLLVEPATGDAVVALGYGLEPLMPPAALDACLAVARQHLAKRRVAAAAGAFFQEMQHQLGLCARQWPEVFGLREDLPWFDSSTGVLEQAGAADGGDAY